MKLTKVLSLVLAIAMLFTMTTFAAFTDVKSDANYAEAVDVLSALKILDGYPEGDFKPDGKITRGEFSKVVAGAVGMSESAKANATGGIFKDVATDLWSSGYIATAYQAGIVNGMGDGTFAPEAEVTYDQAVKMLVAALGYTPKATALGGYPTGYMMVANQEGITVGTANAAGGASRATVARLVYNALTVPMMDQTSFGADAAFEQIDNQSLLLTKLNVIKAEVKIAKIELDKEKTEITVQYKDFDKVAKADGFFNSTIGASGQYATKFISTQIEKGDVEVAGLQGKLVSALIDISDDSEPTLIALTPKAGKNKELVIEPSLFVGVDTTNSRIQYYKTEDDSKPSDERIEANFTTYLNLEAGTPSTTIANTKIAIDAITAGGGNSNDVSYTFVDTDDQNGYDTLYVQNTGSFIVGKVLASSFEVYQDRESGRNSTLTNNLSFPLLLDPEEDKVNFSIKDQKGNALKFEDIKTGSVIDVTFSEDSTNKFYDVVVCDSNTIEGTITETYTEVKKVAVGSDVFYKIGDKDYKLNGGSALSLSDSGKFILTAAGKIIDFELNSTAKNFGVVINKAYDTGTINGGTVDVQLITAKGEIVTASLATDFYWNSKTDRFKAKNLADTTVTDETINGVTMNQTLFNSIVNTLVTYELNSNNEIRSIFTLANVSVTDTNYRADSDHNDTYNESSNKYASKYLNDSTVIFTRKTTTSSNDKADFGLSSIGALEDEKTYADSVFVYDNTNNAVLAVLINGFATKPAVTNPVMFVTATGTTSVDSDTRTSVTGLVQGKEVKLVLAETPTVHAMYAGQKTAGVDTILGNADDVVVIPATPTNIQVNDSIQYVLNGAGEIDSYTHLAKYITANYTVGATDYKDGYLLLQSANAYTTANVDVKTEATTANLVFVATPKSINNAAIIPNSTNGVITTFIASDATLKGYAVAGKVNKFVGNTAEIVASTTGTAPAVTALTVKDVSINANIEVQMVGTTYKLKSSTIDKVDLVDDVVDDAQALVKADDIFYVYKYDGDTIFMLNIDTASDNNN